MIIFNLGAGHLRAFLLASAFLFAAAHGAAAQHHQHAEPPRAQPSPAATPNPTPRPSPTPSGAGAHDASGAHSPHGGAAGQHDGHGMPDMAEPSDAVDPHQMHGAAGQPMTSPNGSGTSWEPASTPAYMIHEQAGKWTLMFHGEAKIGVNAQGGPRGVTKFESQNWFMPMASRGVGRGTLELRGMFSAEPLTYSGAGSPQLFQTGEVYRGRPIVDAQHPHDLLMELSAKYTLPVGERGSWFAYFGYPGEPALGPVAFMHRASASENPSAPLAHHLQDSTHIAFGVFTTGFTYRWLKVEGSVFNGREPDEDRYGFEAGPWDSRSVRVSVAPSANWVFQYSYGLLKNPELLHEGDTRRQTASVQYNRPLRRGNWATGLIWGRNREGHEGDTFRLNSYTLESTLNFLDRNYVYTRLELVDKKDILRPEDLRKLGYGEHAHPQFRIGAYTFGYVRDLYAGDKYTLGLGGNTTLYSKPEALDALYGRNPVSYKMFLRIRLGGRGAGHGM
ncbi:MAG: hypothetical protein JOZ96_05215 [Acidobacteria bacterium]|nr:hypothetical protein [Acidobacteriota bacterium]